MFSVIITYRDGSVSTKIFDTKSKALAFMGEEVEWENTVKAQCPELRITMNGVFYVCFY